MAGSTSDASIAYTDEKMNKELEELVDVKNYDEYDNRLGKISNALSNWMKVIFNKDTGKEEFKAEWLTVRIFMAQILEKYKLV